MLKRLIRRFVPRLVYDWAVKPWRLGKRYLWSLGVFLKRGRPGTIIYFGIAPGDDLLCTVVLREMKKRGLPKTWIMSKYPELFEGNADLAQVVPIQRNAGVAQVAPINIRFQDYATWWGGRYEHLVYAPLDMEKGMSLPPPRHILAELCAQTGITGEITLCPHLSLTDNEKKSAQWASGMIVIQSSGLATSFPMKNKQWFPERFQQVVDRLKNDYQFVQLGSVDDPPLNDVVDLIGKTPIRETAAVLANCRLYVGNVGFLMHLARAVECPSVIIYGGREAPWQSGYSCNANLYRAVPCAPCWLWNRCDYDRMCMDQITVDDVVDAIGKSLARPRNPLAVDHVTI